MSVPAEVHDLIKSSGNNFHAKVARWFTDNDWRIVVSPYYMDQTQNKAREIDLVARKLYDVKDVFGKLQGLVEVRLFVECKYISTHSVCWFADKDKDAATNLVCSGGLFQRINSYTERHHYISQCPRVAKLFASAKGNNNSENEPFYKALNQVLNAMTSMRGDPISEPENKNLQGCKKVLLEFPVVVCNSFVKMYSVDFDSNSEPKPIQDNFQLEVSFAYIDGHQSQRNDYFLVDVIEFDKLNHFVDAIDEDARAARALVADRWRV